MYFKSAGYSRHLEYCYERTKLTHILGITLSQSNLVSILQEQTDGAGVSGHVSAGKSLVRHVEVGENLLLLDEL